MEIDPTDRNPHAIPVQSEPCTASHLATNDHPVEKERVIIRNGLEAPNCVR